MGRPISTCLCGECPTAAQLRHRGITLLAARRRAGGHARDAELHGWRYIFDHEKECA